ncbi:MAG: hypothetical protein V1704_04285 [Candidatus Vogelbacteria bacterium]
MFRKFIFNSSQVLRQLGWGFEERSNPQVIRMLEEIKEINGAIKFKIEHYPDGSWAAESTNVDGIITGGNDVKETTSMIKDAIFTYYQIPPQFCNDNLLKSDNEAVKPPARFDLDMARGRKNACV